MIIGVSSKKLTEIMSGSSVTVKWFRCSVMLDAKQIAMEASRFMQYYRPTSLADALTIRASSAVRVLAGGTDFYPALRDRPVTFPVLDVSAIEDLRHVGKDDGYVSIGANATWTDLLRARLPKAFDGLKLAAREVGSLQIQNRGTVAGNLCNASPAADGVPPLLTLDAEIEIASARGLRREPLQHFITGNRKTTLAADELVTRILVPETAATGVSSFRKLGARKYLVISIAMVAVRLVVTRKVITEAMIAVGSCSEVARRLPQLEAAVLGLSAIHISGLHVPPELLSELAPITDVRGTADYRLETVPTLIRDTLAAAVGA
jgi:CO/xanthine dehydrogenase FAD-binding subunit